MHLVEREIQASSDQTRSERIDQIKMEWDQIHRDSYMHCIGVHDAVRPVVGRWVEVSCATGTEKRMKQNVGNEE